MAAVMALRGLLQRIQRWEKTLEVGAHFLLLMHNVGVCSCTAVQGIFGILRSKGRLFEFVFAVILHR